MKKQRKPTIAQITARLTRVASTMERLGRDMEYYGGFSPLAQHGIQMQGAAQIARTWVKGIKKDEIS